MGEDLKQLARRRILVRKERRSDREENEDGLPPSMDFDATDVSLLWTFASGRACLSPAFPEPSFSLTGTETLFSTRMYDKNNEKT